MLDSTSLLQTVASALREHPHLRSVDIQVSPTPSGVILSGSVNSFFVKQMAQEAIRELNLDIRVDNQLTVQKTVPSPLGLSTSNATPAQSSPTSTY